MTIQIPTEDSIPVRDVSDRVTLIYGERKVGKSAFCSQAPNPLFIATEPGQSHLRTRKIEVADWPTFLEVCRLIYAGDHDRETIVIDTIDNLYKFCRDHVLTKNGLQHESDKGFGAGYDLVNGAFFKALNSLSLLPYGLMMISHSQEKEVKNRTGKEPKIVPTLSKGANKIVCGMADYILYACVEEINDTESGAITGFHHVLRTQPTTLYEAGMRLELDAPAIIDPIPLRYSAFVKALKYEQLSAEDWLPPNATSTISNTNTTTTTGGK
jgi:hypothetical protein